MTEKPIVAAAVTTNVSSEQSHPTRTEAEITASLKRVRKPRAPSSERYLMRAGSAWVFQLRVPASADGKRLRPIQIGLGVLPKREEREIADRLAAVARMKFRELANGMAGKENNSADGGDAQNALLLTQLTLMLKSALSRSGTRPRSRQKKKRSGMPS